MSHPDFRFQNNMVKSVLIFFLCHLNNDKRYMRIFQEILSFQFRFGNSRQQSHLTLPWILHVVAFEQIQFSICKWIIFSNRCFITFLLITLCFIFYMKIDTTFQHKKEHTKQRKHKYNVIIIIQLSHRDTKNAATLFDFAFILLLYVLPYYCAALWKPGQKMQGNTAVTLE